MEKGGNPGVVKVGFLTILTVTCIPNLHIILSKIKQYIYKSKKIFLYL